MAWRITVPNKLYRGVTESVQFQGGEAVVEDEILRNVLVNNYGYSAEEIGEPEAKAEPTKGKRTKK